MEDADLKPEFELNTVLTPKGGRRNNVEFEGTIDNSSTEPELTILLKCLVCSDTLDSTSKGNPRTPIDELKDLLQVLGISSPTLEQMSGDESIPIPSKVFCESCSDQIFEAVDIIWRIECLQDELKSVKNILEENLVRNRVEEDGTMVKWISNVRTQLVQSVSEERVDGRKDRTKMRDDDQQFPVQGSESTRRDNDEGNPGMEKIRVQLISSDTVLTGAMGLKKEAGEDREHSCEPIQLVAGGSSETDNVRQLNRELNEGRGVKMEVGLEERENESSNLLMSLLAPDTVLTEFPARNENINGSHSIAKDRNDIPVEGNLYVEGLGEFGDFEDESFCLDAPQFPDGCEEEMEISISDGDGDKKVLQSTSSNDPLEQNSKLANRKYVNGKVISLDCPYCEKTISREDFRKGPGHYVYKCVPECCNRTMSTFMNFVWHHEASCPSKPKILRRRRRKRLNRPLGHYIQGGTSQSDLWVHDVHKKIMAFECSSCGKKMSRSDYETDSGELVFKCNWESCPKITKHFPHLCIHHKTHCSRFGGTKDSPNKNQVDHSKLNPDPSEAVDKVGTGRRYDEKGSLIALECHYCEKTLTPADFVVGSTNIHIYRCSPIPICCGKVFASFPALVDHHESQCKPIDIHLHLQNSEVPTIDLTESQQTDTETPDKQLLPMVPIHPPPESFKCKHCSKIYKSEACQSEDLSGAKVFKCCITNCGKEFTSFLLLRSHHFLTCPKRARADGIACNICNRRFTKVWHLNLHKVRSHIRKWQNRCDICEAGFRNHNSLIIHMKQHSGEGKFKCPHCKLGFNKRYELYHHKRRVHSKSENIKNQVYDERGKLMSLECLHCLKTFSRDDFLTESGEYLFKCFPECCNKITNTFSNLACHHEAFCPSRPKKGISMSRKKIQSTRGESVQVLPNAPANSFPIVVSQNEESNPPNLQEHSSNPGGDGVFGAVPQSKLKNQSEIIPEETIDTFSYYSSRSPNPYHRRIRNRVYDQNESLISYDCPHCQRNLAMEDYATETDDYFFKCLSDGCDEIADDFPTLVSHHDTCCPSKPGEPIATTSPPEIFTETSCGQAEAPNNGLFQPLDSEDRKIVNKTYDEYGTLIAYECPNCHKKLSREDYPKEIGDYLSRCFPVHFSEMEDNFPNLVAHHEAYCLSRSKRLPAVTQSKSLPGSSQGTLGISRSPSVSSLMKYQLFDEDGILIAYDCPFCHKNFARENYTPALGIYLSSCFPDYFVESGDNFPNLIAHHEAFCPSKPAGPTSTTTEDSTTVISHEGRRSPQRVQSSRMAITNDNEDTISEETQLKENGYICHPRLGLVGFQCPFCQARTTPSDFKTADGKFVYMCPEDSCGKITRTFANVALHHKAHCPSYSPQPLKRKWSTPYKWMRND